MFQQRIFITQAGEVFWAHLPTCKKHLLPLSYLSVCLFLCVSAQLPLVGFLCNFFTPEFYSLLRNSKFGYNRTRISGTVCEDEVLFIVAGNIKSP